MGSSVEAFQLSVEAAEFYEANFVPRLFGEWASHLVEAAGVFPGQRVLDVACGTGVVARAAAKRVGAEGTVAGLDVNESMLTVARRLRPDLEWRQGDAAHLPFPDASFDVVLCQSGLMFFPDVVQALREMGRVAVPGGTVAVQVWDRLESQPAYLPFTEVAALHAGPEAAGLLGAYFVYGALDELAGRLRLAGLEVTSTATRVTTMRFDSVDEFVATEVESTPLAQRIDDEVYRRIREGSRDALRPFAREDGGVDVPIGGHLVTARRG